MLDDEVLTVSAGDDGGGAAITDDPIVSGGGTGDGGAADGESTELNLDTEGADGEKTKTEDDKPTTEKEEPELSDFRGAVSGRIRSFIKQAPELGQIFKKFPAIQSQIESTFRREAAMREIFPTVAEARTIREYFPNGVQDVTTLLEAQQESEAVDNAFYEAGPDGTYPHHSKLLDDMFKDNREATVALFKTLPKEWARMDRASYNETMSKVVAATFIGRRIPEFLADLVEGAKGTPVEKGLKELQAWVENYTADRQPSEEEQRLAGERAKFNKEKSERASQDQKAFHTQFVTNAKKLQLDTIGQHRVMKKLAEVKSITPEKRAEITEKIRKNIEGLLTKSPAFMRKLRAAYDGRNADELAKIQKAAWSQPWLLNAMIRRVLKAEVPQLVQGNREVVTRRAGAASTRTPANPGDKTKRPTGPYQVGGRWYKQSGEPFTTQEIVAGKHQQS